MKRLFCLILAVAALGLCACSADAPAQRELFAMDTLMSLQVWGDETVLGELTGELTRLDALLSVTDASSDIARLNDGATIDGEAAALVARAAEYSAETGGAFDPTVYPLVRLWGFTEETQRVPDSDEIASALAHVGTENILLADNSVTLQNGAAVDLGGIAKGYAADCCAAILSASEATAALLSLGGNVQTYGTKPDGSDWQIGIADPAAPDSAIGVISVGGTAALVTSGGYQRNFTQNGKTYHHILDPETGAPAESGLSSVTVIADCGAMADAYSTALFVMGLDEAIAFWRETQTFEAVFITDAGEIFATSGVSLSGCEFTVVTP